MSNIKDIQEAAEKWADKIAGPKDQQFKNAYPVHESWVWEWVRDAFLAGSHSIGEEIVKQLEEANPWSIHSDYWNGERKQAWNKCVIHLRSLINQQSLNNKQGI